MVYGLFQGVHAHEVFLSIPKGGAACPPPPGGVAGGLTLRENRPNPAQRRGGATAGLLSHEGGDNEETD